ncbi:MAG: hypothetical protein ABI904_13985 [Chloroflexota bacterium]
MKPRHWINLLVVGITAGLLTYLTLQWAITSYVEPTCKSYAESKGLTYSGYIPLDPSINASHSVYEGDCKLHTANGEEQTVSLVKASGTRYGAPLLVSLALSWHLVFGASFVVVALILAMFIRVFTGKPAS